MKNKMTILVCVMGLIGLFHSNLLAAERILKIGSISDEPKEEVAEFKPFADYLAKGLRSSGITGVKVVVVPSMQQMVRHIKAQEVDIFIDSAFPVISINNQTGAKPLLWRWKKGVKLYKSVIFTRSDSHITSMDDLKGKMIAFEEEFSTSGYFVPKATLIKKGYTLTAKDNFRQSVSPNEIGYVFSYDDENTLFWVGRNKVDAGAFSDNTYNKMVGGHNREFKVLFASIDVPRHILSCRPGLNPELLFAMKRYLTNMHKDAEGIQVLKFFSKTTKFDGDASELEKNLNALKELFSFLKE